MTEGEFHDWQVYAARRMLPQRRIELYLAQIAFHVARMNGSQSTSIADFLFDPEDSEPECEATADEAAAFFDFQPSRKD